MNESLIIAAIGAIGIIVASWVRYLAKIRHNLYVEAENCEAYREAFMARLDSISAVLRNRADIHDARHHQLLELIASLKQPTTSRKER